MLDEHAKYKDWKAGNQTSGFLTASAHTLVYNGGVAHNNPQQSHSGRCPEMHHLEHRTHTCVVVIWVPGEFIMQ
jgi:hypothetical protein